MDSNQLNQTKNQFKFPEEYTRPQPVVSFEGVEINLEEIPDQSLSFQFCQESTIRANTTGFNALIPKYDNETIIHKLRDHILPNCSPADPITYDGALKEHYVPELLNRLEELMKQNQTMQAYINFSDARMNIKMKGCQ